MDEIIFEWDNKKEKINKRKHGISFEEARTAFYDENAILYFDPDHSDEEDRFILLGISFKLKMLVVCHYFRENDSVIRSSPLSLRQFISIIQHSIKDKQAGDIFYFTFSQLFIMRNKTTSLIFTTKCKFNLTSIAPICIVNFTFNAYINAFKGETAWLTLDLNSTLKIILIY